MKLFFFFYHLPFVTHSTCFHIFIAFNILTCDFTSYRQSFTLFFFKLENDLSEIETSLVFILKYVKKEEKKPIISITVEVTSVCA